MQGVSGDVGYLHWIAGWPPRMAEHANGAKRQARARERASLPEPRRRSAGRDDRYPRSSGADQAELGEGSDAVVETIFLDDPAVLEAQHGRAGEVHLAAGSGG